MGANIPAYRQRILPFGLIASFKWVPSMGLSCWVPISGRRDKATAIEKDVEIQKYFSFYTPNFQNFAGLDSIVEVVGENVW